MSEETTVTSIRIKKELWRQAKIHCAKEDIDLGDFIEGLIREALRGKTE